jgi:release factor glutamine methyltransferase
VPEDTRKKQNIWRVIDILKWGEQYFSDYDFENPRREIEYLIQELLNCKRVDLYLRFDEPLAKEQLNTLRDWINRRKSKEPAQYITGKAGFYNIELNINNNVLIPRPESELIIESVLEKVSRDSKVDILDIGTGSGCLALALAKELPKSKVVGIDISENSIQLANTNANNLNFNNVEFLLVDILKESVENKFDIVVSNPPYIPKYEMSELMDGVANFEPHSALTDNNDGLTFYRRFAKIFSIILKPNAWFFLEVGSGKHPQNALEIFNNDKFTNIELTKDYNGDDRVLKAQLA